MCIGNALSFLDKQLLEMWSELNGTESSPSTRLRVLNLWVWVSKALLMRGHPSGMDAATKVSTSNEIKYLSFSLVFFCCSC